MFYSHPFDIQKFVNEIRTGGKPNITTSTRRIDLVLHWESLKERLYSNFANLMKKEHLYVSLSKFQIYSEAPG